MDELMLQFSIEARELIQQASDDLLALEREPNNRERLESLFRAIHTLKGSVGLFDFGAALAVLHCAEDLLVGARAGDVEVDVALIDPLLEVIEWIDRNLDTMTVAGRLSDEQNQQAAGLLALLKVGSVAEASTPPAPAVDAVPDWALALREHAGGSMAEGGNLVAIRYEPHPECFFHGDDPLATMARLSDLRHVDVFLKEPLPSKADYDPFRCNLVIEALSGSPLADVEAIFRLLPDQVRLVDLTSRSTSQLTTPEPQAGAAVGAPELQNMTMRVDVARIDALLGIAGELITAKNGLLPLARTAREAENEGLARLILASQHEIDRLVSSLYSAVTRARLIPLDQTFRRFPRLVRETASRLGKSVDFIIEGQEVEADREIVEHLFEPMLHLVRNAMDHGIEPEAERLAASKPPRGRLVLRARQRGDQVVIELSDDGRGVDAARIRSAAVAKGLIEESRALQLSDEETLQLIFAPGFSTASAVTDLSGRGVGLDAVRNALHRLGGVVEIASNPGAGTVFSLRLPVSFSMSQLMVVEVGSERYGIPIDEIVETHRLRRDLVQSVRAGQAFVLRDQTVPLLYLGEFLQMPQAQAKAGDLKVLIVQVGNERLGIAVDGIADRAATLTRPLSGLLRNIPGVSGTTLLGDGKVLLVLNLEELVQ
ncbi:chemotaxis protein CheA [Rhizobium deserti]|uniref:Chemotaxis protein CheA n=1 Tax=Rhizobium deserti TaxID=2547961 RepID=A0A4R5UGI0_9HYPH|nr:chemotaxis protein CheA [Rhizobium deserti]TDK35030.1 chemotaxis protein CheA [Rhizobium deserti]